MSELTPKEPKTPEEKRARAHKIRTMVLDMFLPVLAALFLILAVIWPNSIMASLAGIFAGAVLIRFSVTRYQGERGMQVFDKLAMAGGIVLIPVSYTHLDVYKRQFLEKLKGYPRLEFVTGVIEHLSLIHI